jgi:hypothetical protein
MAGGGTAVRTVSKHDLRTEHENNQVADQCDADGCYSPRKYNVLKGRHFVYCPKRKVQTNTIYKHQSHILQTNA